MLDGSFVPFARICREHTEFLTYVHHVRVDEPCQPCDGIGPDLHRIDCQSLVEGSALVRHLPS